jgi:polyhydroxyalkanoate synthesis regulator protein
MANAAKDGDTVIIKKYANRRLYNTRTSSYITLDHLAQMVKENIEFKVLDAKTGADLTHTILTQLIAMYGNSMQALLPGYLEASMEHFRENQVKLRKAIEESIGANPLAQIAQRNMELFKAATAAFVPGAIQAAEAEKAAAAPAEDELAALRKQMADMQQKLDQLSR